MSINKNNYEIYILDYYEGTLTMSEEHELQAFLIANPDIKEEFDSFENISIVPDKQVRFDLKLALKQTPDTSKVIINDTNYKEYFIASIEGDLDNSQQKQLEIFLQNNPTLKDEYKLFSLTKLIPDTTIVFENKKDLKKFTLGNINKKVNYATVAIAASFLILFGASLFIKNNQNNDVNNNLAITNTNTEQNFSKNTASIIDIPIKKHNLRVKNTVTIVPVQKKKVENRIEDIQIAAIEPKNQIQIQLAANTSNNQFETRDYYTNISGMLNNDDENDASRKNRSLRNMQFNKFINPDDQIAEVQDFIYNVANKGYAKIGTFTTGVRNTYKSIEQKLAIK
ncbi:MAG: lipocalin/fatty-acid binding family protein [Bacteroidota bacterium]